MFWQHLYFSHLSREKVVVNSGSPQWLSPLKRWRRWVTKIICEPWFNLEPDFWSNYSDLTGPHSKWWFSKGNPRPNLKPSSGNVFRQESLLGIATAKKRRAVFLLHHQLFFRQKMSEFPMVCSNKVMDNLSNRSLCLPSDPTSAALW